VKRKSIIIVFVSVLAALSTIAVRADRYSNGTEVGVKSQVSVWNPRLVSRLFSSSFIHTREEGSYLVLEGAVFLFIGALWLRRVRREQADVTARTSGGAD
jgi:hypothetical protein